MSDPIREILKQADTEFAPAPASRGIADRVRARLRRQRQTRMVLGGIAVVGIAIGLVFLPRGKEREIALQPAIPPPVRVDETQLKVSQLVVDLMEKHERTGIQAKVSAADDYLWMLSQERDRTGLILVASGDRIMGEFHDRSAAEANYRQVVLLFPDSPAAATARQRLQDLNQKKGNES